MDISKKELPHSALAPVKNGKVEILNFGPSGCQRLREAYPSAQIEAYEGKIGFNYGIGRFGRSPEPKTFLP
jgi:hypothetical protein